MRATLFHFPVLVRKTPKAWLLFFFLFPLSFLSLYATPSSPQNSSPCHKKSNDKQNPQHLETSQHFILLSPEEQAKLPPFNKALLQALTKIPPAGGYALNRKAIRNLAHEAIQWNPATQELLLFPKKAQPSFCSSACYLAFLLALKEEEKRLKKRYPPDFWSYCAVKVGQKDGHQAWGRFNANGPGIAKWIADLKAGENFSSPEEALPGDFLKIFWNDEIGAKERGHFVIFLKVIPAPPIPKDKEKPPHSEAQLVFWSSNTPKGYGQKIIPISQAKRLIFTRLTRPEALHHYAQLPACDEWLSSLLQKRISPQECAQKSSLKP